MKAEAKSIGFGFSAGDRFELTSRKLLEYLPGSGVEQVNIHVGEGAPFREELAEFVQACKALELQVTLSADASWLNELLQPHLQVEFISQLACVSINPVPNQYPDLQLIQHLVKQTEVLIKLSGDLSQIFEYEQSLKSQSEKAELDKAILELIPQGVEPLVGRFLTAKTLFTEPFLYDSGKLCAYGPAWGEPVYLSRELSAGESLANLIRDLMDEPIVKACNAIGPGGLTLLPAFATLASERFTSPYALCQRMEALAATNALEVEMSLSLLENLMSEAE